MRFRFNKSKSQLLRRKRGMGFEEARELFYGPYYSDQIDDDLEQSVAIGWVQGRLFSVIYEERSDNEGIYYHLVTLWKSTKEEQKLYEEHS